MKIKIIITIILFSFITNISSQSVPELKPIDEKHLFEPKYPKEKKGKWGYANEKGKFVIKPIFDNVDVYKIVKTYTNKCDTIYLAKVLYEGKWGIIKHDGTFLIEPKYDEIKDFHKEIAIFKDNNEYGLLSCYGKVLIEHLQNIEQFNNFGQAWYQLENNWGVLDTDASIILPNIYSSKTTKYLTKNLAITKSNDKYGIITTDPISVIKGPIYDSIFVSNTLNNTQPFIIVKQKDKYGIIDERGKEIIAPIITTNQFNIKENEIIQYLDSSIFSGRKTPYLYYNQDNTYKNYHYTNFDKFIYQTYAEYVYTNYKVYFPKFPYWMRSHLYETLDTDKALEQWKTHNALYPNILDSTNQDIQSISNYDFNEMTFYPNTEYYISINKDMTISHAYDIEYSDNKHISTAKINLNENYLPIGDMLTTLFKSVDIQKIKEYDSSKGTNILYDWESISFGIRFLKQINDENILTCIDMYVNTSNKNTHMQKIIACLNSKGNVLYTIKENGELYDSNNPIAEGKNSSIINVINNQIVLSAGYGYRYYNANYKTTIYNTNKNIQSVENFIVYNMFSADNKLFLIGIETKEENEFSFESGIIYVYEEDSIKKIDTQINIKTESIKYSNGLLLICDKTSGLLKEICNLSTPNVITPSIRYVMSKWDGQNIIGISKNHWDYIEEAKWEYIPKVTNSMEIFSTKIDNIDICVFPVNEFGHSIYGVKYENEPIENYKFGIINYNEEYFTLPIFEDIKWISENMISVKYGDSIKEMTIENLNCFNNEQYKISN